MSAANNSESTAPNTKASAAPTTATNQSPTHTTARSLAEVAVTALKLAQTTNTTVLRELKAIQEAGEQVKEQISWTYDRNGDMGTLRMRLRLLKEGTERLMTAIGEAQKNIEDSEEVLERLMATMGLSEGDGEGTE